MVISFFINNLSTLNLHFEFCLKCINEHVWSYNAFLKCIVNQFGWQLVTCKCLCLNPNPFSPFFPLIIWPFIAVSGPSMKKNRKKIPWKSWSQLEPILLSLSGIFFFLSETGYSTRIMLCETWLSGIEKLQDLMSARFFGGGESYYILMTD